MFNIIYYYKYNLNELKVVGMRPNNSQINLNLTMELDAKALDELTLDELKDYLISRLNNSLGFRGYAKKLSQLQKKLLKQKAAKRGIRKSTAVHGAHRMLKSSQSNRVAISKTKTVDDSGMTIDTKIGLLTVKEVSQLLSVHIGTVRRWSDQGVLKTYRIGPSGRRRFNLADVLGLIKEESSQLGVDSPVLTEHVERVRPKS
jgi:excisionase family DNA binding protein